MVSAGKRLVCVRPFHIELMFVIRHRPHEGDRGDYGSSVDSGAEVPPHIVLEPPCCTLKSGLILERAALEKHPGSPFWIQWR